MEERKKGGEEPGEGDKRSKGYGGGEEERMRERGGKEGMRRGREQERSDHRWSGIVEEAWDMLRGGEERRVGGEEGKRRGEQKRR